MGEHTDHDPPADPHEPDGLAAWPPPPAQPATPPPTAPPGWALTPRGWVPYTAPPPRSPAAVALAALPVHVVACGAVLWVVMMGMFVAESLYDGLATSVSAAFSAALATIPAVLVGLPLRLVPALRSWWFRFGWVFWLVAAAGIAAVVLSFWVGSAHVEMFRLEPDFPLEPSLTPDPVVAVVGIAGAAFGLAHLWVPRRRRPPTAGRSSVEG